MRNIEFTFELELEGAPHAVVDELAKVLDGSIHGLRRGWCITAARGDDWLIVVPDSPSFRVCSPAISAERPRTTSAIFDAIRSTGARVVHLHVEIAAREPERSDLTAIAAHLEEMCR